MRKQCITILGSTGSIGQNTLQVVDAHPERYEVFAISANTSYQKCFEACLKFKPKMVVMTDAKAADALIALLEEANLPIEVLQGTAALEDIASHPEVDMVMAAIVGAAGLMPALKAVEAGKRLLLANKEALVMSGQIFMETARQHGADILPVDSEHNALFQCMPAGYATGQTPENVSKIILTASGGPFLHKPLSALQNVNAQEAANHPKWKMGVKISIDSATMMNKGLEVIEASHLFQLPAEKIEVVIHPQSVIHSMVAYQDGAYLAELGTPDMRCPIANSMSWPDRLNMDIAPVDFVKLGKLEFYEPDLEKFKALALSIQALKLGGIMPACLNASNEVAVAAFAQEKIRFLDIPAIIEKTLDAVDNRAADSIESILDADNMARQLALEWIG